MSEYQGKKHQEGIQKYINKRSFFFPFKLHTYRVKKSPLAIALTSLLICTSHFLDNELTFARGGGKEDKLSAIY